MTATIQTPDTWKDQVNWDDLIPPCAADDCDSKAEVIALAVLPGCCCHGKKYPLCMECVEETDGACQFCGAEGGYYEVVGKL